MANRNECDRAVLSRRAFVGSAAAGAAAMAVTDADAKGKKKKGKEGGEEAASTDAPTTQSLAAKPPAGFVPFAAPGRVIKVTKSNCLQPNGLYPVPEAAKSMLARAMSELTGQQDLGKAFGRFVHPQDKVAIKVNGIAKQDFASNKELVLEIVAGVLAAGVPAENVYVYEQYTGFLTSTRVTEKVLPAGVKCYTHNGKDSTMKEIMVAGIPTKFARQLTECTAVINVPLIKDHSITGYTGAIKNMTHGSVLTPESFHVIGGAPHLALLYAQDVIKSRVRLCITDGFKVMYNGGPLGKDKQACVPHEAVYVSTDPVAMDLVGWQVVDKWRTDRNLPTLQKASREPHYIRIAGELGLGIPDLNHITLKEYNG